MDLNSRKVDVSIQKDLLKQKYTNQKQSIIFNALSTPKANLGRLTTPFRPLVSTTSTFSPKVQYSRKLNGVGPSAAGTAGRSRDC